jgi:hypothetical protein
VIVSGTVANSGGTLFASAANSLIDIAGVVSGGGVEIANGVVEVGSGGSARVTFATGDSGGLVLDGTGALTVVVSGFGVSGGSAHKDHNEYIDFAAIGTGATVSYASAAAANTGGTLTVSSGGTSASVELIGTYSIGNFTSSTASDGSFEVQDPAVVDGGSVTTGTPAAFPKNGIDLPDLAFGPQMMLAYSQNSADAGGVLAVTNGVGSAKIALLGNYIAASFVTAGDGHGGTLVTQTPQAAEQPLLTHPHAG